MTGVLHIEEESAKKTLLGTKRQSHFVQCSCTLGQGTLVIREHKADVELLAMFNEIDEDGTGVLGASGTKELLARLKQPANSFQPATGNASFEEVESWWHERTETVADGEDDPIVAFVQLAEARVEVELPAKYQRRGFHHAFRVSERNMNMSISLDISSDLESSGDTVDADTDAELLAADVTLHTLAADSAEEREQWLACVKRNIEYDDLFTSYSEQERAVAETIMAAKELVESMQVRLTKLLSDGDDNDDSPTQLADNFGLDSADERELMEQAEGARFQIDDVSLNLFGPEHIFRKFCILLLETELSFTVPVVDIAIVETMW